MSRRTNSNSRITLANVISVFGIVLLTALLFLGFLYSGDTLGISILKSVGLGFAFAILLWLMITAKSKTNLEDKGKWMTTEIVVLIIYLALAVVSSGWMTKFVNIYAAKDEIKSAALNDIDSINNVIDTFRSNESTNLRRYSDDLKRALREFDRMDNSVSDLICQQLEVADLDEVSSSDIDKNINLLDSLFIENVSSDNGWEEQLSECQKEIKSWSILEIPKRINNISSIASDISEKLTEMSEHLSHYSIKDDPSDHVFKAEKLSADKYEVEVTAGQKLNGLKASPWGYGACALIHLLILFNYFVTRRSIVIRNRKTNNTAINGGRMLNIDN